MDASPNFFEQLQQRLACASEPLEVLNQFEEELLYAFPAEAAAVIELVASWGHRLGVLTREDIEGYV
ncbi:hypothetical protein [Xanthomonas melonis]|uniref:Uncharacterized protein n=1 Tax=Xanthomonas melonis TaxID=56456 RepID=A0A2S7DEJ0_9XANT|nr:hypothetical protein [Xanthomonas melonis]MCC4600318.1 hypothetical protein [Xanthomonas melonis]PPU72237.1 hypothetical protein XmelCFBP4644_12205 [Xanthomonas melonis]